MGMWVLLLILCWSMCDAVPDYFIPFGRETDDTVLHKNDDGSSDEQQLSVQFPYFGQQHSSLFVNTNGVLSFLVNVRQYTPDAFPLGDQRRLVAPFWADVDTRVSGDVYFREITSASTGRSVLDTITSDIRLNFPQYENFNAVWAFVVTWNGVGRYGGSPTDAVNTFQAVLTTNGRHSFAIFNYGEINWLFGTASNSVPAQVGFNAGDNERFYSVNGSRTEAIQNVNTTSNVGRPGRWMFRVEQEGIVAGGCNLAGSVVLGPRYASFLGGRTIDVAGPCFNNTSTAMCDFNGISVQGSVVSDSKAQCIAPATFHLGKHPFRFSTDNGATFSYTGTFWFVETEDEDFSVKQVEPAAWRKGDLAADLVIEWNKEAFSSQTVSVDFVIIREDDEGDIEPVEVPLAPSVENTGRFQLPPDLQHAVNPELGLYGGIRVREKTLHGQSAQSMWSAVGPSVWYVNRVLYTTAQNGPNSGPAGIWNKIIKHVDTTADNIRDELSQSLDKILNDVYHSLCKDWYAEELKDPHNFDDLPPPPCTLEQALNDPDFTEDPACNMGCQDEKCCDDYHKGAFHCVRSVNPSANNAGQQACYNEEGSLLPFENGGGTVDRAHPGSDHWIRNVVSIVQHFWHDVRPYYYCCKYTKKKKVPTATLR